MVMPRTIEPAPGDWTVEDLWELPADGQRYEIIEGELFVTPAPRTRHQRALMSLIRRLDAYVSAERIGELFLSPADIQYGPRTLVQPDLFVAPFLGGKRIAEWKEVKRLVLAVEVLSPGTAARDRGVKRRLYQEQQTGEYWVVDVDEAVVERWRPGDERPEELRATLEWWPAGAAKSLTLDLVALFAEIGLDRRSTNRGDQTEP